MLNFQGCSPETFYLTCCTMYSLASAYTISSVDSLLCYALFQLLRCSVIMHPFRFSISSIFPLRWQHVNSGIFHFPALLYMPSICPRRLSPLQRSPDWVTCLPSWYEELLPFFSDCTFRLKARLEPISPTCTCYHWLPHKYTVRTTWEDIERR